MPKGGKRAGAGRPAGSKSKHTLTINLDFGRQKMKDFDTATIAQLREHHGKLMTALQVIPRWAGDIQRINLEGFELPELGDLQTKLKKELAAFRTEIDMRDAVFEPFARCVHQRLFVEIPRDVSVIKADMEVQQKAIEKKRKLLLDDGIAEDQAAAIYPDYDSSADLAKIADLEAERAAWEKFDTYRDEKYLPENAAEISKRISPYNSHLSYIHKRPE
jgi:hypothetical protein